jgi:hypothetical protein
MEMANSQEGDWALTSVDDPEEFKNENGYLEMCREYKKSYEQRKNVVDAEEVIIKEDENKVVEVEYVTKPSTGDFFLVERNEFRNDPHIIRQVVREMAISRGIGRGAVNFITGTGTKPREYKR